MRKTCFWHEEYPNGRVVLAPTYCKKCKEDLKGYFNFDRSTLCEVKKRFLFWEWKEYDHNWGYFQNDTGRRKCLNCGEEEFNFSDLEDKDYVFRWVKEYRK